MTDCGSESGDSGFDASIMCLISSIVSDVLTEIDRTGVRVRVGKVVSVGITLIAGTHESTTKAINKITRTFLIFILTYLILPQPPKADIINGREEKARNNLSSAFSMVSIPK